MLVADVYRSVQFIRWVPDRNELSFLGQDLDGPLECYGADFLVSKGQVGMVVTDSAQNVNVFQVKVIFTFFIFFIFFHH